MKPISEIQKTKSKIRYVLSDIDDTMTDHGQMHAKAYSAMWKLKQHGIELIPVTGRPAGWCEMIARLWPVAGVIGENGGFYFRYDLKQKKMLRHFFCDEKAQTLNRQKLNKLTEKILSEVPGSALASDQFCRLMDLAIDFCEDVPALPTKDVEKIVKIFDEAGAHAKVSSIHVNGWFGEYNKLSQTLQFLKDLYNLSSDQAKEQCLFIGDSPNDEPMWEFFPKGVAVQNIQNFISKINFKPAYICNNPGGEGFAEMVDTICSLQ